MRQEQTKRLRFHSIIQFQLEIVINQINLLNNILFENYIIKINVKKCKQMQGFALKQGLIDYSNLVNNNVISSSAHRQLLSRVDSGYVTNNQPLNPKYSHTIIISFLYTYSSPSSWRRIIDESHILSLILNLILTLIFSSQVKGIIQLKKILIPLKLFFIIICAEEPGPLCLCCQRGERPVTARDTRASGPGSGSGTRPEPEPGTQNTRVEREWTPALSQQLSVQTLHHQPVITDHSGGGGGGKNLALKG